MVESLQKNRQARGIIFKVQKKENFNIILYSAKNFSKSKEKLLDYRD